MDEKHVRYEKTEKARARQRRYRRSPKGRLAHRLDSQKRRLDPLKVAEDRERSAQYRSHGTSSGILDQLRSDDGHA